MRIQESVLVVSSSIVIVMAYLVMAYLVMAPSDIEALSKHY